jgi:MFS family permease
MTQPPVTPGNSPQTNSPVAPRPFLGVFYGWWIVAATVTMAFIYSGFFFYSFTLFISPISDELPAVSDHVNRAFLLGGAIGAALAPFLGGFFDRRGPRLVVGGGMVAGGAGFFFLSVMTEPWHLYIALPLVGIGPVALWQGAIPAVANWFLRLRGRALGLTMVGLGLGGFLTRPSLLLMEETSWQTAFQVMAVVIWVLLVPLALVLRRRPEDHGFLPDGDTQESTDPVDETGEEGVTFKEAMKSPVFWTIALAFSFAFWPIGGLQIHMAPYMEDIGYSRTTAADAVGAMAIVTVVGRLGGGWLADIIDQRKATMLALALQAIGTASFAFVLPDGISGFFLLGMFFITFAPGFGGITVLQPALLGTYFGRKSFGAIQGVLWAVTSLSFSVAPLVLGALESVFDGYRTGLGIFAGLSVLGAVTVLLLPRPTLIGPSREQVDEGAAVR